MRSLCLSLAVVCFLAPPLSAATNGILFLHLQLAENRVSLVSETATPGVLKQRRAEAAGRGIEVELRSAGGAPLWREVVSDPGVRRLEFEDPAEPGKLKARNLILTNAEFTVRVPAHPQGHAVSFARRTGRDRNTKAVSKQPLGEILLKSAVPQP